MGNPSPNNTYPLAMAAEGEHVKICGLSGSSKLELRLSSMGLQVGSVVTISQREGGSLVVISGETRLALNSGMAQKILVTQE